MIRAFVSLSVALLFASAVPASARLGETAGSGPAASSQLPNVHFSTTETVLELLLDDPQAKAVVDKHIPGLTSSEQISLAGGLTLSDLQQYLPGIITTAKLAAIEADFQKF